MTCSPGTGTVGTLTAEAPSRSDEVAAQLRSALRRLAKAVVVVTCRWNGARFAMTATAVTELSMAPPSLLVCVNHTASIYEALRDVEYFGVNILHSSHRPISESCSGATKGEARFEIGRWTESGEGVPYLCDAQAVIICGKDRSVDYGTHGIFFGRVVSARVNGNVSPLIYMDGRYVGDSRDI